LIAVIARSVSDEAIQMRAAFLDCFASIVMTVAPWRDTLAA
jgi:hypothetical protein